MLLAMCVHKDYHSIQATIHQMEHLMTYITQGTYVRDHR